MREGSNHVEVVVGNQLSRTVFCGEEFLGYSWRSILGLDWQCYGLVLLFGLLGLYLNGLYDILIVIGLLFLSCFYLLALLFALGVIHLLPQSLHVLELLHGGPLVERLLVVQAHLLEGLPQIEQPRLALDQGEDEVTVFGLVLIPQRDVDLSEALRDSARIGKHLEVFRGIRP